MHLRTAFLWTMIGSLSLAAAVGVAAILFPTSSRNEERVIVTALLVGAFSVLSLACSIVLGRRRLMTVMAAGIVSSLAAAGIWVALTWGDYWRWRTSEELMAKSAGTFTIVAVWSAHLGLLMLPKMDRPVGRVVRSLTLAITGALAVLAIVVLWLEVDDEPVLRLLAVLAILAACGTVVSPVMALIEFINRRRNPESVPAQVKVSLTCPRCHSAQQLSAGHGRCGQCGLRIDIDIEEPRCACGYLLYKLEGDKCPECGAMIPAADRWAARADAPA